MLLQTFTVLALLAIAQSILLLVFLLGIDQKDKLPNVFLSILLFDFGLGLLGTVLIASGYYKEAPHLLKLGEPLFLVVGPIILFYVQSLFNKKQNWKSLIHFIPFLIYSLSLIPFYLKTGLEKIAFIEASWVEGLGHTQIFGTTSFMLMHILLYLFPSYQKIKEESIKNQSFTWLLQLIIGFIAVIFFSFFTYGLMEFGWITVSTAVIFSSIMVAALIYTIGFFGFKDARQQLKNRSTPPQNKKAIFSKTESNSYLSRLDLLMKEEKIFVDSKLTLKSLAQTIDIQPYQLSQLLNDEKGGSFPDYVNQYRVKEIQMQITNPQNDHLTLLGIAMDAGFNTKSAFNQAFKKFTGKTPSAYRKEANDLMKR